MIKNKKNSLGKHNYSWTKIDRKTLEIMVREGRPTKEISDILGRTPSAVNYQRSAMGLVKRRGEVGVKTKEGKGVSVRDSVVVRSPRDKAKEMASVARGIARENGKRITMAMFFVEDL